MHPSLEPAYKHGLVFIFILFVQCSVFSFNTFGPFPSPTPRMQFSEFQRKIEICGQLNDKDIAIICIVVVLFVRFVFLYFLDTFNVNLCTKSRKRIKRQDWNMNLYIIMLSGLLLIENADDLITQYYAELILFVGTLFNIALTFSKLLSNFFLPFINYFNLFHLCLASYAS